MIEVMGYEDNFFEITAKIPKTVIIYGAGTAGTKASAYLDKVNYFCDRNAKDGEKNNGIDVILPEKINEIMQDGYVLVCVNRKAETFKEICEYLTSLNINAKVFNYYNNIAFNTYKEIYGYSCKKTEKPLRVRIISYDRWGWIFTKFAKRMEENLKLLGVNVDVAACCDPGADINHHISHYQYDPVKALNDTVMITHVDSVELLNLLKFQMQTAKMGICMSKETMDMLVMTGIPREKLCYVTPAHDAVIKPKKYVLGITHRNHVDIDQRKRVENILEVCKKISPEYFSFIIMGDGWDKVVDEMRKMGFETEYYDKFDYDTYTKHVMPSMDYYLFFGYDEGSMGFMDALAAGVKTIVTPQGFHLDIRNGITYACETLSDFIYILRKIQSEREDIVESVSEYTWMNYSKKHIEIWEYVTRRKTISELCVNKHMYNDGIFSLLMNRISD
jgi:glycosyltransferase involved in cell wall biosynthesis